MIIHLNQANGGEQQIVMKNIGIFKLKFEVFNDSENLLFILNLKNNWSKLNYDYDVEVADYQSDVNIKELQIYCAYAANLYLTMISEV